MSSGGGGGERRQRRRSGGGGDHGNHERWLLPYSDMITLLLALFVVLYSISSVNNSKLDALSNSLAKAFNGPKPAPVSQSTLSSSKPTFQQAKLNKLLNSGLSVPQLNQAISSAQHYTQEEENLRRLQQRINHLARRAGLADKVATHIEEQGLVITLVSDKVLFDTGQAYLRPQIRPLLTKIAELLRTIPNNIRVAGHTDNVPIHTGQFASNWELSAVRATTVVRFFIVHHMHASHLSAAGFGAEAPTTSNATVQGRARNRRVEIVIVRRYLPGAPAGH